MSDKQKYITPSELCDKHQALLIHQAKYLETDPWRALLIAAQIVLFQAATCHSNLKNRIGEDITKIGEVGCLACFNPAAFGELVEVAKAHDIKKIKELGDKWVNEAEAL